MKQFIQRIKEYFFWKTLILEDEYFGKIKCDKYVEGMDPIHWYTVFKFENIEIMIRAFGNVNGIYRHQRECIIIFLENFNEKYSVEIDSIIKLDPRLNDLKGWQEKFNLSFMSIFDSEEDKFTICFESIDKTAEVRAFLIEYLNSQLSEEISVLTLANP